LSGLWASPLEAGKLYRLTEEEIAIVRQAAKA